jgi:hypothetical protein
MKEAPRTAALSVALLAASALACGGPTPVEPSTKAEAPTPVPTPAPTAIAARTWTGAYSGASVPCNSAAAVTFPSGAFVPTEAIVPCLNAGQRIVLKLNRSAGGIWGYALWGDSEIYPVTGTLTPSAMDMTIFSAGTDVPDDLTGPIGTLHLHP